MKKKTLALVLSTAMVAALAAGCGSKKPKETEAVATEAATEKAVETEKETEKVTEKAETEAATEVETKAAETEAAETELATEAATEAKETEAAETELATEAETEAKETEAAETELATEAETEAKETEAAETEAVTEAEETEGATEAEETEAEETEAATEAEETEAEETEAEETEATTEAVETEAEETEAATEAEETEAEETEAEETEAATEAEETEAEETEAAAELVEGAYTIGVSQFAEHGSLDNCREGFLMGLEAEGFVEGENLTVEYDNSQADTGIASQIADNYVSENVDLICAIATPSAMSAYNSAKDTEIPVIYTAVSDPVAAGLADESGAPAGNITGTSDKLPVEEQLKMIREMMPDAKKIGILYTTSETNSESTIAEYKEAAPEYGFEIVDTGINTIADVDMAAADLVGKVDCISNLTDNTVVSALQTVLKYANDENIPVFGSEIEQVKNGCLASMGIDYIELGKQTGEMAAAVLKGEATAAELNFEVCEGASLYVNTEAAEKLGMELDADMVAGAAEVFDTITVE